MKRYSIHELKNALIKVLKLNNVSDYQAMVLVDTMLAADMRGVHTHGISVFPAYINKIKNQGFNLYSQSAVVKKTSSFAVVDANNCFGMVTASECMKMAIDEAKASGIYTVFCRNANTFGAAFRYAEMATEKGMIGMCFANSPSAMPAWGGDRKILGTNPFAIGIPADKESPILIDMATSVVAKSKINEIRKQGGTIPEGWAVDEFGKPTTDPSAAIKGMVLPMAGHKGYAIAMAIDVLAGVLSGAGYLNNVNRFYSDDNKCMNVGHCFVVINPALVFDESFYSLMDDYIAEVHASGEKVLCPGEIENRTRSLCNDGSVELGSETVESLEKMFAEHGIIGTLVECCE